MIVGVRLSSEYLVSSIFQYFPVFPSLLWRSSLSNVCRLLYISKGGVYFCYDGWRKLAEFLKFLSTIGRLITVGKPVCYYCRHSESLYVTLHHFASL